MIKHIKRHIDLIYKIFLFIYVCFGIFVTWNIDYSPLKQPLAIFIMISIQVAFTVAAIIYLYFLCFKDTKNDIFYRNIFIATTTLAIASFPFSYGILEFGRQLSLIDGIQVGSADGWLAFIGSIVGGMITMLAVIFTITNEKNIRREDARNNSINQAILSTPVIVINLDENTKHNTLLHKATIIGEDKLRVNISRTFLVENVSNNFALFKSIDIDGIHDSKSGQPHKSVDEFIIVNEFHEKDTLILPQSYIDFEFYISIDIKYGDYVTPKIILTYTDYHQVFEYKLESEFVLDFSVVYERDYHEFSEDDYMIKNNKHYYELKDNECFIDLSFGNFKTKSTKRLIEDEK